MTPLSCLLDTDWVIDHLNGIPAATQRIKALKVHGLALSIISVAELWEGVHFSSDPTSSQSQLEAFLAGVTVLGLDQETCQRFGRLRGSLRRQRKVVADFDLLIAATAIRHNLSLLSRNVRHFENVPDLRLESLLP